MTIPSPFQKEIDGAFPERVLYQDSLVTVLESIAPQSPVHMLIVPNRRIATLNDTQDQDAALLGHMLCVARDMVRKRGIAETGYRLAINTNEDAGQSAFHIHLHILGGVRTGPMVDQGWRNIQRRLRDSTLAPFEKRILGFWAGKGTVGDTPADISMRWEPELQDQFLLLSYRAETRDSSGRNRVLYEGKGFYKKMPQAGRYTATFFDSAGENHFVEAAFDGTALTAFWGQPAEPAGKIVCRFLSDNTLEITDFQRDKKSGWAEYNRTVLYRK